MVNINPPIDVLKLLEAEFPKLYACLDKEKLRKSNIGDLEIWCIYESLNKELIPTAIIFLLGFANKGPFTDVSVAQKLERNRNEIDSALKRLLERKIVSTSRYMDVDFYGLDEKELVASIRKIKKRRERLLAERERLNSLYESLRLHPRIKSNSSSLFTTGNYAQAIFEAFKSVEVFTKEKSGIADIGGQSLMAKVFNEKAPIIKLNDLQTTSEKDEQIGFKFIYMGAMTGIRNPKAHDIIEQSDPYRTLEYLSFASLLARRIEEGKRV